MHLSLSFCLYCTLGFILWPMSEAESSTVTSTNKGPTVGTVTSPDTLTTQTQGSPATAPQSTATSAKNEKATSSVPTISTSFQQTVGTTQATPVPAEPATSTRGSKASSQASSPTPGATHLTNTASSSETSSAPGSSTASQGAKTSPSDVAPTAAGRAITAPTDKPTTASGTSTGRDVGTHPSASTGKTVTTLSSLAVPTVLSPAPGGDTLTTTSLEGSTTATQTQETPTSRGHATSLTPGDFSPVLTPTAAGSGSTSQRLLVTVPGTGPSKPDTGKPPFAIKIVCERHNLSSASVIILNQVHPRPCDHSLQVVEKGLPEMLCLKVKSTFTPSTDQCTVRLGYSEDPAKKLAILGVSVESHSAANEIYEMLAGKTEKLKEFGFSAVNYPSHKERSGNEDWLSMPLIITIVCMAVSLLLIAAIYGWWHQRHSTRKDQQRLTEELQTVENGYHDNPTLDVMETSPEMQEKKAVGLNGELGDSWIVPMDHLGKEDLEEEEDTHL